MRRNAQGFTLIELLIAIVIIGILSAIAIPNYTEYVNRAKRVEAQAALSGLAIALERYYSNNNTYCGAAGGAASFTGTAACPTAAGAPTVYSTTVPGGAAAAYYNLRIADLTQTTYTLQAQRTGAMASDKCGTLTLSSTGAQGISGQTTGTTVAQCWKK